MMNPINFYMKKSIPMSEKSKFLDENPNFFKFLNQNPTFLINIHFASQNCRETPPLLFLSVDASCLARRDKATTLVTRNIPSPNGSFVLMDALVILGNGRQNCDNNVQFSV